MILALFLRETMGVQLFWIFVNWTDPPNSPILFFYELLSRKGVDR